MCILRRLVRSVRSTALASLALPAFLLICSGTAEAQTPIHAITGSGYTGQSVTTAGIVTAVRADGFFLETRTTGWNLPLSSPEGLYVRTGAALPPQAVVGNEVAVTGTVAALPSGAVEMDSPSAYAVVSTGNPLPDAIALQPGDTPLTGTASALLRYAGMRATIASVTVMGAPGGVFANGVITGSDTFYGVITGVYAAMALQRTFLHPATANTALLAGAPGGHPELLAFTAGTSVNATTGSLLKNVTGVVDFSSVRPTVLMDAADSLLATGLMTAQAVSPRTAHEFTIATQSLQMPAAGAGYAAQMAKLSLAVRTILLSPDILAVQAGSVQGMQDLATQINTDAAAAGETVPQYAVCAASAADGTAFLYNSSRVNSAACTALAAGATFTDSNGGQQTLFTHSPLLLKAVIRIAGAADFPVTVISSQFSATGASALQRELQAEFLAGVIQQHQQAGEHVVAVGGYNAPEFSDGSVDVVGVVQGAPADDATVSQPPTAAYVPPAPALTDLALALPQAQRYSAVQAGVSQLLDHVLVTPDIAASAHISYARLNADFPASDWNDATRAEGIGPSDGAVAYFVPLVTTATLTPASQDFGNVVVGQTSNPPVTFTFSNSSGASETVTSVVISPSGSDFSTPNSSNCTTVASGGSCSFTITFTPSAAGTRSATLTVSSTDANNPTLTSSLTGTGVAPTTTSTLTPSSSNFGSITVGQSSSGTQFTLTNTGNTTIGNITVGASGDYSATYGCSTLAPTATCPITVVFSPTGTGTRTGTLTVSSTSSSSPLTAGLTGTGLSSNPGLILSTYSADLGSFEVHAGAMGNGSAGPVQVYMVNNDTATITFSAPLTSQGPAFPTSGDFAENNNCGQTLAPGVSCRINAYFIPTTTGTRVGSITIASNASNGTQTLALSGNGTDYAVVVNPTSVSVKQGDTAVYAVSLTPVSGYNNTIAFDCSTLTAKGTGCSGITAVTLGPATTVNLSVTTTSTTLYGVTPSGLAMPQRHTALGWMLCVTGLLALALAGRSRRLAHAAGLLALLLALLLPAGGCSGKQPGPNPDATPPGTYNFTLKLIDSQQLSKQVNLTLVVTAQ